jgi:outer membrane protein
MALRHGVLVCLSLTLASGASLAETLPRPLPPRADRPQPIGRMTVAQTGAPARPSATPLPAGKAGPAGKPAGAVKAPADIGAPRTLAEALAATYANQPALQAERAKLRATDENVPQALAGWRPTVVLAGTAGYGDGFSRTYLSGAGYRNVQTDRVIGTAQATVTQNLYTGGRVQANVNRSRSQVMAERATLLSQEQTSFLNTINAYVGVIQAKQLLALNVNNEQVLGKQLQATNDRYRVGEITRTDVAQAEAALAQARANRETAEGNLQIARGNFQQVVGVFPPDDLIEPQPLVLPVGTEQEAASLAGRNNPSVVTALFNDSAAKDAVDVAFAALLPQVNLQGQTFQQINAASRSASANGYQVVAQLSVPLYQGGAEYSAVRAARQTQQQTQRLVDDARRNAMQTAVQYWSTYQSNLAAASSFRVQIASNETALEGVEREAIVGSRTTLDVLTQQQTLLQSRTSLIQSLSQLVTSSYQVAAAIGRLTARDLHLPVPLYDETAYYNAVKDKWIGLGDQATDQPGR